MGIGYKKLVEDYRKLGPVAGNKLVRETYSRPENKSDRESFDLGRLFEEVFGHRLYEKCKNNDRLVNQVITEDSDGVTSAAFQGITGQIMYSTSLEKYQAEEFVFTKLIPEMPSKFSMMEKIPGITQIGDKAAVRAEGDAYAVAGVGENYIHAPGCHDRGFMIDVTREAIFDDRTGLLMEYVGDQAYALGLSVEKRAIDCVIDLNTTAASQTVNGHRYHWKDTSIASYGDNSGTHTWDNLSAATTLLSWESLQAVDLLFAAMVDPFTGEPIEITAKHVVVCPDLLQTAKQILSATEIRKAIGGYATSGNLTTQVSPNTVNNYDVISSRQLKARQVTVGSGLATTWYAGDISKYAKRKVNWPMDTMTAPAGNNEEITRQIVYRARCNEKSSFFVYEPRAMVKATVA